MLHKLLIQRGGVASRVSWAAIAQAGKLAIQFGGIAIMTRLLPVSDFGLLAMAALFTTFALLLQDMGTSAALIQRKELTTELVSTVFWLNVFVGVGICAILIAISPVAALVFAEPRLEPVLMALALVFPLTTIGTVPISLMQRTGRLRQIGLIELGSATAALAIAVLAAQHGFGVYSLVIQQAVGAALQNGMLWLCSEHYPQLRWSSAEMKRIWGFTGHLVAFNTLNYFNRNADKMLMARFLGAHDLALYSMGYRFIIAPLQFLGGMSNRVLLPIYSEKQSQPAEIGTHFVKTLALISIVIGPMMALLWGLRQPVVAVLLGPDWYAVADVLAWFAPVGFIQAIATNVGLILIALGKTKLLRNLGFVGVVLYLSVFFACIPFGIVGVAAGYFFANVGLCAVTLHIALKLVHQSLPSLFRAIWKQTLFSCLIGLAAWVPIEYGWLDGISPFLLLVILAPLGMVLYLALVAMFLRDFLRLLLGALRK
ncbi:lipopolysaccharide biosynthesis protein [Dongia sp.]|uniref:lipopolysaccharide biosynthesis protein n=1 Tax=Dongia sp. TaxID=1977262 RepID=UPI00375247A3